MAKFFQVQLITTFFIGILLSSCNSKKENFDIDLSNYKLPIKSSVKAPNLDNFESLTTNKETIKNELKNYPTKSEVLSATKFGKKDPFSEVSIKIEANKLDTNFQLKGFLKTNLKNYAFISYLGNEGTITEESIGGVNTDLLPDGAKVLNIDSKNMKLIIEFENDNFTFEL